MARWSPETPRWVIWMDRHIEDLRLWTGIAAILCCSISLFLNLLILLEVI
jgi:hypothetical protein